MLGFFRDLSILLKVDLPPSFSRNRLVLNFLKLSFYSFISRLKGAREDRYQPLKEEVYIESDIWRNLCAILSVYVKYILPKYMMETYVIQGVATSWHSQEYIDHLDKNFTQEDIKHINPLLVQKVDEMAKAITQEFTGLDYAVVRHWLLTYQYGLSALYGSEGDLYRKLEDCFFIEIGPGTGANAAVHASISKKGVYLFDIPPMLEVQKIIIGKLQSKMAMSDVSYFHDAEELMRAAKGKPYVVVSYWAFTEFSESLRNQLEPLLQGAAFSFFACNSKFEKVKNLTYFNELQERLEDKTVESKPIHWQKYKGHAYVIVK